MPGNAIRSMRATKSAKHAAATIWATSLVRALRVLKSSINAKPAIPRVIAMNAENGASGSRATSLTKYNVIRPSKKLAATATPPPRGVGVECDDRSFGTSLMSIRIISRVSPAEQTASRRAEQQMRKKGGTSHHSPQVTSCLPISHPHP